MFSHQTKFHLIKSTNCQPRTSSIRRQLFPKEVQFRTWRESVILLESSNPSVSKNTLFGGQITHFSAFFRSSSQILSTRLFEPKGVHSHVYIIWRINFRLSRDGVRRCELNLRQGTRLLQAADRIIYPLYIIYTIHLPMICKRPIDS